MRSLPESYDYLESFVDDSKKVDHETFADEIIRILGAKNTQNMNEFFKAQRKSGESVLSYFSRILMLYKTSNNFKDDNWQKEFGHVSAIYAKIFSSCYLEQQNELSRKTETSLESGELTLDDLKSVLVSINKLSQDKVKAELVPESISALSHGATKENNDQKKKGNKYPVYKKRVRGPCWFCNKDGHLRSECFKFKATQEGSSNREPKDSKGGRWAKGRKGPQ